MLQQYSWVFADGKRVKKEKGKISWNRERKAGEVKQQKEEKKGLTSLHKILNAVLCVVHTW